MTATEEESRTLKGSLTLAKFSPISAVQTLW